METSGTFKVGHQKVGGRKKKVVKFSGPEIAELLKGSVGDAVATVLEVMKTARVANDRLKAAMWILERVYGKARETVEHKGRVEIGVNRPAPISRDEWLRVYAHGRELPRLPDIELINDEKDLDTNRVGGVEVVDGEVEGEAAGEVPVLEVREVDGSERDVLR